MKVREVMTRDVDTCHPWTTIAAVTDTLWRRDCGVVPVIDGGRHVVGIVTDRDICIALGTRNRLASELTADEVMSKGVVTCRPDDDLKQILGAMRRAKVHRIPVIDSDGTITGIISLNDIIRCAAPAPMNGGLSESDVVATMKSVCEQRIPLPSPVIARR